MWLVFLFLFIVLGIVYSKIEFNLYKIIVNGKEWNFRATIVLKFFGIIPVLVFNIDKKYIKFLNFKICYLKIFDKKDIQKFNKNTFEIIKNLNIEFDKIFFNLKIGVFDIILTNIAIVIVSSILPRLIQNRVKRKNLKYQILPIMVNEIEKKIPFKTDLSGEIRLSIKSLKFVKLYFKNIKKKITHNNNNNFGVKESF